MFEESKEAINNKISQAKFQAQTYRAFQTFEEGKDSKFPQFIHNYNKHEIYLNLFSESSIP